MKPHIESEANLLSSYLPFISPVSREKKVKSESLREEQNGRSSQETMQEALDSSR